MEIGGVERSLLGLLDTIDYNEYDVDLFLFSHTGEFMDFINKNANLLPEYKSFAYINWPIIKLFKKGKLLIGSIRLFCKFYGSSRAIIKKSSSINITLCKKLVSLLVPKLNTRYDIALGFFGPHYFLDKKVSANKKIGWVHTDYANPNELPDLNFTLPMWAKLDHIACVSPEVKASFDKIYPSLSKKTIVFENILSPNFIIERSNDFSAKIEMPDNTATKILSIGRFCKAKAFDDVVIACSKLVEKNIDFKWYLIGYGPEESLIKSLISKYNLENHVIILGKKSNPYPYIKECDIYAQPSRYEGKAVTVTEAQILNKPVMITRYATSSAQLQEGIDGYICEMGIDGIVKGIEYMIKNPDFRNTLINNTKSNQYANQCIKIFNFEV